MNRNRHVLDPISSLVAVYFVALEQQYNPQLPGADPGFLERGFIYVRFADFISFS